MMNTRPHFSILFFTLSLGANGPSLFAEGLEDFQQNFVQLEKQVGIACNEQGRESQAKVQVAKSALGSIRTNLGTIQTKIRKINSDLKVDPYKKKITELDSQIVQLKEDLKNKAFNAAELRMMNPKTRRFKNVHEDARRADAEVGDLENSRQELASLPKSEIKQIRNSYQSQLTEKLGNYVKVSDQFEKLQTIASGCRTQASGSQPLQDVRSGQAKAREAQLKSGEGTSGQ